MARIVSLDRELLKARAKKIREFHEKQNILLKDYTKYGLTVQQASSGMRDSAMSQAQQFRLIDIYVKHFGADPEFFKVEKDPHTGEVKNEKFQTQEEIIIEIKKKISLQETLIMELIESKNLANNRLAQMVQETQHFISSNPSVLVDNSPVGEYIKKIKIILNII